MFIPPREGRAGERIGILSIRARHATTSATSELSRVLNFMPSPHWLLDIAVLHKMLYAYNSIH
jgi:hypothetical protein